MKNLIDLLLLLILIVSVSCGKKDDPQENTKVTNNTTKEVYVPPITSQPVAAPVETPKPSIIPTPEQKPSLTCLEFKKVCERPCKKYDEKDPKKCIKHKLFKVCVLKCIKTGEKL